MKAKSLIWIFAVLLLLPLSFAQPHIVDNFESGTIDSTNKWVTGGSPTTDTTIVYEGTYSAKLPGTGNNMGNRTLFLNWTETLIQFRAYIDSDSSGDDFNLATCGIGIDSGYPSGGSWGLSDDGGWEDLGIPSTSGRADIYKNWLLIKVLVNFTEKSITYRFGNSTTTNDAKRINNQWNNCISSTGLKWTMQNYNVFIDNITAWNFNEGGWFEDFAAQPDTTPPTITGYTNQGASCGSWNTSTSLPCSTGDTTPSLYFFTDTNAFCAIGTSNSNYPTMGSSRNCTSGEGTLDHACTLTLQDELVYQDSIAYISCKDETGNYNATSTSGPLSLTLTGLETGGSAAIGVGVQNALLSGYTNYTSQQIYARNLAGLQDHGTFDWVAKKGTKVWAFNYVTNGESHVGLFNMTPVLYVLEMSNITNSTIVSTVESMINATK